MMHSIYIGLNNPGQEQKLSDILQNRYPNYEIVLSTQLKNDLQLKHCQGAIIWKNDPNHLLNMPNLKLIQCMGAGVDFIDWSLPQYRSVPVCRFVDPSLSVQLAQYVIGYILSDKLEFDGYRALQDEKNWQQREPRAGSKVLILGLGAIGSRIASLLQQMDFQIYSWSTTLKGTELIHEMTTQDELSAVLPDIDYVVNLLPSTPKTTNFINESFLLDMKADACVINVGRGESLDTEALISFLDQKKIRKAILDVFKQEPLPSSDKLWEHPSVLLTPHIAAQSSLEAVASVFSRNLEKITCGKAPEFQVDPDKGY